MAVAIAVVLAAGGRWDAARADCPTSPDVHSNGVIEGLVADAAFDGSIAVDAQSRFVVAYAIPGSGGSSGPGAQIRLHRFDAGGACVCSGLDQCPADLSTNNLANRHVSIAMRADGWFNAAWYVTPPHGPVEINKTVLLGLVYNFDGDPFNPASPARKITQQAANAVQGKVNHQRRRASWRQKRGTEIARSHDMYVNPWAGWRKSVSALRRRTRQWRAGAPASPPRQPRSVDDHPAQKIGPRSDRAARRDSWMQPRRCAGKSVAAAEKSAGSGKMRRTENVRNPPSSNAGNPVRPGLAGAARPCGGR
jgi:hypothetical protein